MKAMTNAQIANLNAELNARISSDEELDAGCTLCDVARDNNLEAVREDDGSGVLYRDAAGRYVYGWTVGEVGFDDQI